MLTKYKSLFFQNYKKNCTTKNEESKIDFFLIKNISLTLFYFSKIEMKLFVPH